MEHLKYLALANGSQALPEEGFSRYYDVANHESSHGLLPSQSSFIISLIRGSDRQLMESISPVSTINVHLAVSAVCHLEAKIQFSVRVLWGCWLYCTVT